MPPRSIAFLAPRSPEQRLLAIEFPRPRLNLTDPGPRSENAGDGGKWAQSSVFRLALAGNLSIVFLGTIWLSYPEDHHTNKSPQVLRR
eukprot:4422117-Pyramimonas_sp.AAC.1